MHWKLFADTHKGASHKAHDLPCQDSSLSYETDTWSMVAVADGHGNRRHFRSDVGSRCACEAAQTCLMTFMQEHHDMPTEEDVQRLKAGILTMWKELVHSHCLYHPWTDEEMEEQQARMTSEEYATFMERRNQEELLYPYGSTLLTAAATDEWWLALQIGDGATAVLDDEGYFTWPMPKSQVNIGNRTASLCMADSMQEFRHVLSDKRVAGVLIYTDGVEKVFPEQCVAVAEFLYKLWRLRQDNHPRLEAAIHEGLRRIAEDSTVKDDASAAGIVNGDAKEVFLQLEEILKQENSRREQAALEECQSTIDFTCMQLDAIDPDDPARADFQAILMRKLSMRDELRQRLGLEPAEQPITLEREAEPSIHSDCSSEDSLAEEDNGDLDKPTWTERFENATSFLRRMGRF